MVDTEAHDRAIIKRINAVCGKNDDLYIAGDLSAGGHKSLRRALYLLDDLTVPHSRIHLILGNHDGFHIRNTNAYDFASVCIGSISANLFLTLANGMPAIISHTPRKTYIERGVELEDVASNSLDKALLKYAPDVPKGIAHLYGHTHGKSPDEFHDGTSINIGLDAWRLRPVSERQIIETLTRMQTTDCT